jgi:RNA polymerase sigma factor (sigma-70 family)
MSVAGIALEGQTTDERLVAWVRRGDDRAFEQLYERYQRRIAAYVYGMVNDYGRAEDLTQEIFVSALRRMRATERPIAFKPWIYEIARNACIDQFRRSRRTEEVSFDADEGLGALEAARLTAGHTPDVAVDAKQQIDDLCGAFGGLSDAHHEILVMRELEGLSYREIGERLGLSRPSVESTLFRARRRLTEEYEELVSGERCRRVTDMLASGVDSLGVRDERRLARHVAHCQPCRRQAYAAGVDTVTLTRHRVREVASKVAALVPIPAFMRLRPGHAHAAATLAEPAAGWTKALAAAAVIVAGGAGVAAHDGAAPPRDTKTAPAHSAPASKPAANQRGTRSNRTDAQAKRAGLARQGRAEEPSTRGGTPARTQADRAMTPSDTGQSGSRQRATPPPAGAVDGGDSRSLPTDIDTGDTGERAPIEHPAVDKTVGDLESQVTKANGPAGAVVNEVTETLGVGQD